MWFPSFQDFRSRHRVSASAGHEGEATRRWTVEENWRAEWGVAAGTDRVKKKQTRLLRMCVVSGHARSRDTSGHACIILTYGVTWAAARGCVNNTDFTARHCIPVTGQLKRGDHARVLLDVAGALKSDDSKDARATITRACARHSPLFGHASRFLCYIIDEKICTSKPCFF